MKQKSKYLLEAVLNLLIFISSLSGCFIIFLKQGFTMLMFYTVDSNILALIASLLVGIYAFKAYRSGVKIPESIKMLKYISVCCLTVTFIVVVLVLAPMNGIKGYQMMLFSGDMLFHHLISPVLSILTFLMFDRVSYSNSKSASFALIPTIIYAVILITLNLLRIVEGPYPFLRVYAQPFYLSLIWFILIVGGAYLIAYGLAKSKPCQ